MARNLALLIQTTKLLFSEEAPSGHALTDQEYKFNMGQGYVFFEILHPEDLTYTYKINPAAFSIPWNMTLSETNLVLGWNHVI